MDALFLDIEGHEVPVLKELGRGDPLMSFACIETIWHHGEIVEVMGNLGYQEVWRFLSGYNSWFVRDSMLTDRS